MRASQQPAFPLRHHRRVGSRRVALASLVASSLVIGAVGPASAAPTAAPAADIGVDLVAKAAAQARAAVAKGLDKGPGHEAPKGAPYPEQRAALAAAAAAIQSGPKLGSDDLKPSEVVRARTRTTRTTQDPVTGTLTTQFASQSLNYQDGDGKWQPIDTNLAAVKAADGSAGGWTNGDNRFDAAFPASLADGPVTVTDAADKTRTVSLQLLAPSAPTAPAPAVTASASASTGATGASSTSSTAAQRAATTTAAAAAVAAVGDTDGTADGSQVTYPDAAGTGVDVAYDAAADAVKETITLDSAAGAAALASGGGVSFALSVGKGLTPTVTDTTPDAAGGEQVTVSDAKGGLVFLIPPAFMDDAKGAHSDAVTYTLTGDAKTGWTLTLTPDADWLAAKDRAFPVVVDPTIQYPSPMLHCALNSAAATTSACSGATMPLAWDSTNGNQQRALLRFDDLLNVVPADSTVLAADLKVNVEGSAAAASASTSVDVRELTAPFTNAATWNTRNGSTAWGSAGGDVASLVSSRRQLAPGGGYQNLDVAELVSRWVEGTSAHNGFALSKTTAVSGGGQLVLSSPRSSNAPALYLEWESLVGQRKADDAIAQVAVTDRTGVSVNPATGNAAVATTELNLSGVGLDLRFAHTSNSLSTARLGPYGYGWNSSVGGAGGVSVQMTDAPGNHVKYTDGNGARWTFYRAVDGTYVRPAGLDVDLTRDAGADTWTLTDRFSKVTQTFTKISTGSGVQNFYGLALMRDRNSNQITYTYDATATVPYLGVRILRSVTDTRGRVVNVTNPGYFASATTDASNRSVYYTVTSNQMTQFKDASGNLIKYTYDSANRVTRITSSETRIVTLAYDSQGRVTRLVNSDGTTDSSGNPGGPAWIFAYNSYTRSATGSATTTTTVTDPRGQIWTYVSDGRGRVAQITDPRGKTTSSTFTVNDDIATETAATPTAGGGTSSATKTYNSGSWTLAGTRVPTGAGVVNSYGSGARLYDVSSAIDARGVQTTYAYDPNGNQISATTDGITTTSLYQGSTDPAYGGTVNCGPTVNNVLTATKSGLLCETRDGAYVAGATAAGTTAHRTLYRYDAVGQMTQMIPPTPSTQLPVTYRYDSLSHMTSKTDGKNQTTFYGYDAIDRLTYTMYPDGSTESFYFTADGPLRSDTEYDATNNPTRYTQYNRDKLNRLVRLDAPEGVTVLGYDTGDLLTRYDDGAGETNYGYNAAGQLTSLAEPGGTCSGQSYSSPGAASTKCTLFQVNDDGHRVATRYPGGQTLSYTLDDAGRPSRILGKSSPDNGSSFATRLDIGLAYTDTSAPATSTNPNKDSGLITSVADAVTSKKVAYSYDALDRLTVADTTPIFGGASTDYEAFCYDGAGNRSKSYTTPGSTCATANPAMAYSYDGANAMTSATPGSGAPTLTGPGFNYDANGSQLGAQSLPGRSTQYNQRDAATMTTTTGGSSKTSTYAGGGNAERLTDGSTSFKSSLLASAPASATQTGAAIRTIRDPSGTLVALQLFRSSVPTTTSVYPMVDQVNSIRALVTSDGQQLASYAYRAFGQIMTVSESLPGGVSNPYRFAEGYQDADTGLIKLGARFYDPQAGRFTQPDPSGQEANCYVYAANNPISLNDPNGLYVSVPYQYEYAPNFWDPGQKTLHDYCSYSPDTYYYTNQSANFRGPCAKHDMCLDPKYRNGRSNATCNQNFYNDLRENCRAGIKSSVGLKLCYTRVNDMVYVVRKKNP